MAKTEDDSLAVFIDDALGGESMKVGVALQNERFKVFDIAA